uniref:ADP-ribosylation factor-like protein 6 n=1 Tax=Steinernema glaseri TaxID=37863 RepID=A0A1I7ZK94_9BILA
MGILSSIGSIFTSRRKAVNILVLGLDNSGKTTIINKMKPSDTQVTQIVPTVGYSVDRFTAGNMLFSSFDMSGQSKYRNLWENYYSTCEGIAFVVDSNDRLRMAVARDELWMVLDHKDITSNKVPIIVFANKMDEKGAMTPTEVTKELGLDSIRDQNWTIVGTCALTGEGLQHGMEWLASNIRVHMDKRQHK